MKKGLLFLFTFILLFASSCREDITIDYHPENPYGVVFTNDSKITLLIECDDLVFSGRAILDAGESTDVIYGPISNIEIEYSSIGGSNKKKMEVQLEKDKVTTVVLSYP